MTTDPTRTAGTTGDGLPADRPTGDGAASRVTLLLRLAGPLQSWGISSRYASRDTGAEPSKSGVIGLVAAALGLTRDTDLADVRLHDDTGAPPGRFDLTALRFGVRVDHEGVPAYDFQTVGGGDDHPGIAQAKDTPKQIARRLADHAAGRTGNKGAISISQRYLLQDAVFLVGLETDRGHRWALEAIDTALTRPVFPIGLGRRGYVPSLPVAVRWARGEEGVRDLPLECALRQERWPIDDRYIARGSRLARAEKLRVAIEPDKDNAEELAQSITRNDQPVGAAFRDRVFGPRAVRYGEIPKPTTPLTPAAVTTADPTAIDASADPEEGAA